MTFTWLGVAPLRGAKAQIHEASGRSPLKCSSKNDLRYNVSVKNEEIICYENCLRRQY